MSNFSWEALAAHEGFRLGVLMPIRGLQLAAKQLASCDGLLRVFIVAAQISVGDSFVVHLS